MPRQGAQGLEEGESVWEAGGRRAKPGEKQPAFGLLKGQSLRPDTASLQTHQSPPKAQGPACVLGPGLWRWPQWVASWILPLGRLPGPRSLSILGSLPERHPPGQRLGEWVTPRVSGIKPEDSTFWPLLPGSGPKR